MERVNNLVLFLILVEFLWVSFHLCLCFFWANLPLLVKYVSCIPNFSKTFILKDLGFLSKTFCVSNERIEWFMWRTTFIYLHMWNYLCISRMKPMGHGWWSLEVFLISICKYFPSMFIVEIVCNFLSFGCLYVVWL